MKTTDTEILICPGFKGSPEDHWQTRWERKLSAARRVHMGDWHKPVFEDWKRNLVSEVARAKKPVVLVGHSLGCQVIVQAAREFTRPVIGNSYIESGIESCWAAGGIGSAPNATSIRRAVMSACLARSRPTVRPIIKGIPAIPA